MARKRHSDEDILKLLREIQVRLASVWQAKSSLCTMVPFRPIRIARA
jgi:hypothetical protein